MKISTQRLMAGLLMATLFTACSRPVAYFQPTQREHFAKTTTAPSAAPVTPVETASQLAETPATPIAQATSMNEALDQMDAIVRNDRKLADNKAVQKRLNRIRTLASVATTAPTTDVAQTTKKAGLMERMMLKKMNKKISKQLAPKNPNKTMISTGTLATGAVLVILGLLLLLLTTGTGATVGLIALLAGAVVLLIGLL